MELINTNDDARKTGTVLRISSRVLCSMRLPISLLSILLSFRSLTEYDYIEVIKNFADSFIAPANKQVSASVNSLA